MRRITEAVSNSDGYVYLGNEILALRDDEHDSWAMAKRVQIGCSPHVGTKQARKQMDKIQQPRTSSRQTCSIQKS